MTDYRNIDRCGYCGNARDAAQIVSGEVSRLPKGEVNMDSLCRTVNVKNGSHLFRLRATNLRLAGKEVHRNTHLRATCSNRDTCIEPSHMRVISENGKRVR